MRPLGRSEVLAALEARLATRGLETPALDLPDALHPITEGLPDDWDANGNLLLGSADLPKPHLGVPPHHAPPRDALVVLAGDVPPVILIWGDAPMIVLGAATRLPQSWVVCGGATIAIGARTACTSDGRVDARNGGIVSVGADGLWATGVMVNSDHMHAIRDRQGRRLNAFGGTVEIARHVWLGHEALLMPGARIGADTVIGARSIVSRPLPANAVCAGSPARVLRRETNWTFEDLP